MSKRKTKMAKRGTKLNSSHVPPPQEEKPLVERFIEQVGFVRGEIDKMCTRSFELQDQATKLREIVEEMHYPMDSNITKMFVAKIPNGGKLDMKYDERMVLKSELHRICDKFVITVLDCELCVLLKELRKQIAIMASATDSAESRGVEYRKSHPIFEKIETLLEEKKSLIPEKERETEPTILLMKDFRKQYMRISFECGNSYSAFNEKILKFLEVLEPLLEACLESWA